MEDKVSRISIGIRHRRSFRLPEISGSIVDYIIYEPSSPFGNDFFHASDVILDNFENKGRILIGKDSSSSIIVDTDSLILNLESSNLNTGIKKIKEEILPFVKKIFKEFDIKNINRVGIVFEFKDSDLGIVNKITNGVTDNTFGNTDHFVLRFSQKDIVLNSLVKKEILDYANNIVAITKTDDGIFIKFDYQFYYSPEISSINDVDFDKFIEVATDRLSKKLFNWYKKDEESE